MSRRNGTPLFNNVEWEQTVGYMKPHLEALPKNIYSLLDIGAAHGHFSMMWNQVFGYDTITMIEANPLSCEEMSDLPWQIINKPVGTPGKATFYTNPHEKTGGGSSLYIENTPFFKDAEAEEVNVVALDSLNVSADMVKIDVQGAELDVIKSGYKTISKAKYLVLELSFTEYNKDAPLIDDVLEETRRLGFRMIDTFGPSLGGHWFDGVKTQVDVILRKAE